MQDAFLLEHRVVSSVPPLGLPLSRGGHTCRTDVRHRRMYSLHWDSGVVVCLRRIKRCAASDSDEAVRRVIVFSWEVELRATVLDFAMCGLREIYSTRFSRSRVHMAKTPKRTGAERWLMLLASTDRGIV